MLVVAVVALALPIPTPWMQALCPVGFGYFKVRSLTSRLVHAAVVAIALGYFVDDGGRLLALVYAVALGAVTLVHDALDETLDEVAADAYVLLPDLEKQFSTAKDITLTAG